ncbi:MAG: hypothetical protein NVSMB46_05560 [Candidatus Saccharimonadales bacterium]
MRMQNDETTTSPPKKNHNTVARILYAALIVVLSIGGLLTVRFSILKNPGVHYHANFAVYIKGQKVAFDGPGYYQEVQVCSARNAEDNPQARVHMHDQNNHLIHIHSHGVTWSQFFTNLGYGMSDTLLSNDKDVYIDGTDGNKLTFMLNGKLLNSIADKVIGDKDVLLVNYGNEDIAVLKDRTKAIPNDAAHADVTHDPSSCSGSADFHFKTRLLRTLDLRQ